MAIMIKSSLPLRAVFLGILALGGLTGACPTVQAQNRNIQIPGGDFVYHAAHFSQEWQNSFDNGLKLKSTIDQFGSPSLSGKKVAVVTWFASAFENGRPNTWGEKQRNSLDKVQKSGAISLIKFSSIDPNFRAFPQILQSGSIGRGEQDVYFANMAGVIKRFGGPVFISINHEMNGQWYPYSQAYDQKSLGPAPRTTAADYVKAWQRIWTIFQKIGATNAIWMWSPNAEDVGGVPFQNYYPGDNYVDWIGVSLYSDNPPDSLDRLNTFAQSKGKPIFINEWATGESKNTNFSKYRGRPFPGDAKWVTDLFRSLDTRYPNVKGISWFETNKRPYEDNFLLERVPDQARAYATAVKKPRYVASSSQVKMAAALDVPRREEAPRELVRTEIPATALAPMALPRPQVIPREVVRTESVPLEGAPAPPRPRIRLQIMPTPR
jgi:hypothetical protein